MKYIFAYNINPSLDKSKKEALQEKISHLLESKFDSEYALYEKTLDNFYIVVSTNPNLEEEIFKLIKNLYLKNKENIELISTRINDTPKFTGILKEGKWDKVDKITRPLGILDKQE